MADPEDALDDGLPSYAELVHELRVLRAEVAQVRRLLRAAGSLLTDDLLRSSRDAATEPS